MTTGLSGEPLSVWEKADRLAGNLSTFGTVLYSVITGAFRGKSGAKDFSTHVAHAVVRKAVTRLSIRQLQSQSPSTFSTYETWANSQGIKPEVVKLNHGAEGLWIGNKNAKNVVVYYHGGGFILPAVPGHFTFLSSLIAELNKNGHDVAIFFLSYTLSPPTAYPTQLRQAIEALRYILNTDQGTGRSPSDVIVGGDSAGGNLALSTLLHLTHPRPEIDPLDIKGELAGVFGFAPWVSFSLDGKSMSENAYKDLVPAKGLKIWSEAYLGERKEGDAWSEPARAPTEWWNGVKAKRVLILAGGDEILLSAVQEFTERFKTVVPQTTYIVGYGDTHISPVYSRTGLDGQQARGLRNWLGANL
ncbi:putative 6-hexanolactone hydrolase [Aspergillus stella-maris]|uniref:putative 6-hexanolactone hydrolase n=1 Tax=Aspergillus stella-maris TaxID=1810926 RepID=UPI003CCDB788